MNYFGISEFYKPIPEIEHWLRRRVRACYWKQWKKPRKRIGELLKLGVSKKNAITVGMSRKGPWRLARTMATQVGMTNKWLEEKGLISIKDLWVKIHYPGQIKPKEKKPARSPATARRHS
jgi:RNA-directed DNA polymerase